MRGKGLAEVEVESQDQIDNMVERVFKEVDTNKDGKIEWGEVVACLKRHHAMKHEGQMRKIFDYVDKNHDGAITRAALEAAIRHHHGLAEEETHGAEPIDHIFQ